jgi:prolipoprotein diacylglyceryltransferase
MGRFEKTISALSLIVISFFLYKFFIGDITEFVTNGMFIKDDYRIPLFLIESTLNVIGFLLIVYIVPKFTTKNGIKASLYFV